MSDAFPPAFWPLAGRVTLLIVLEAGFALVVKALRRGSGASRASIWARGGSWVAIGVIYFAVCGFGTIAFGVLAGVVAIQALRELVPVVRAAGWPCSLPIAIGSGIAYVAGAAFGGLAVVVTAAAVLGVVNLAAAPRSARRALATFAAASYVGVPLALLVALRRGDDGFAAATWTIMVVSLCDVTSMFGGLAFGRRRFAPTLSPNKTLEGVFAGLAGAVVGAAVLRFAFPHAPVLPYYAVTLAVALAGIGGDLFASVIKRAANVKDFGAALPGHGGVMDRVDSLLFAVPLASLFIFAFAVP